MSARPGRERPPSLPPGLVHLVESVSPPDARARADVETRIDRLTKPRGSLGRLERLAARLAVVRGDPPPAFAHPTVYVLAADHGVGARGVSAYPREVTARMCRNFARGGAAINALSSSVGCRLVAADFGVDADLDGPDGILDRKVGSGTADLTAGPAMTEEKAVQGIRRGAALLDETLPAPDVVALGEMGIGNSTAAAAITAALTGRPAEEVVGPGTGVDGEGLQRKREAVRTGVTRVGSEGAADPFRVLQEVGGFEIAGLVGVVLAGARAGVPIVSDGFIATAAAALAVRMAPASRDYLFAGHLSPEPGHRVLLEDLGLEPILDLELRLGEGTGAVLALPILDAAGAILREMATFEEAGIARSDDDPDREET